MFDQAKWERQNRPRRNAYRRQRGYNRHVRIPLDEVELLVQLQGETCAMRDCGRPVAATDPQSHVDHTHDGLDIIRGILCLRCNTQLGQYEKYRTRETVFQEYIGA